MLLRYAYSGCNGVSVLLTRNSIFSASRNKKSILNMYQGYADITLLEYLSSKTLPIITYTFIENIEKQEGKK